MTIEISHPAPHAEDISDKKTSSPFKDNLAAIFGIIVLVAYAGFIFYLLTLTGLPDAAWNRAIYLFGGTEAIAFAAAGALFGHTVQRQQTQKAEDDAKQAKQDLARTKQEENQQKIINAGLYEKVGVLKRAFARSKTITTTEEEKVPKQTLQELQMLFADLFPEHTR